MSHVVRRRVLFALILGLVALAYPAAADPATTCEGLTPTHVGTGGDDVIIGTDGDDVILARGGNDTIDGGAGNDTICGNGGDDVIDGGEGDDVIRGGGGEDTIDGGPGSDSINGGPAKDFIEGGAGQDDLQGKEGRDQIYGGAGSDTIRGGENSDRIWGDGGNDVINGQEGDDKIRGGFGDDNIRGQVGDDRLWGTDGDDLLFADSGVDTSDGGDGFDRCLSSETAINCEDDDLNDAPIAVDDVFATDEDTGIARDVLVDNGGGADADPNSDPLTVTAVNGNQANVGVAITLASGAEVTVSSDGTFAYDPSGALDELAVGESLDDELTYTVSDPLGESDDGQVTVEVSGVNDRPDANNDRVETNEDTPILIAVLENDEDVDGDEFELDFFTQPDDGIVVQVDDSLLYTPDPNFNGEDSFTYRIDDGNGGVDTTTVFVTVDAVNDDPVAVDDSATTDEDNAVSVDVLDNDSDVDGDTVSIDSFTQPEDGSVAEVAGELVYTPDENFNGEDSFTYTVSDGNGGSDTATVEITVDPVADPPIARDDTITAGEDDLLAEGNLLDDNGNGPDEDGDGDELSVTFVDGDPMVTSVVVDLTNGDVEVWPDGEYDFIPGEGFDSLPLGAEFSDSFIYTITDGVGSDSANVVVTLLGENDDPVADGDSAETDEDTPINLVDLLDNDDDVDTGDEIEISGVDATSAEGAAVTLNGDGSVTYDPQGALDDIPGGDSVEDTFEYTISDGNGGTDTATVTVTVNGVNDDPDAVDDEGTIDEDGTELIIPVLGNDSDVDGDAISVSGLDVEGTVGLVTVLPDETIRYNPFGRFESLAVDEEATDTFEYEIDDGNGGTDDATVTVTVTGVNDAPVAVDDDEVSTDEDTPVDIAVLDNDSDVDDSDELTVTVTVDPEDGTAVVNEDGTVTYTPDPDFNGEDSFTYQVDDGNGGTDTAIVTVTVDPVNDDPVADDDEVDVLEDDGPAVVNVLGNDSDVDGDVPTVTAIDTAGTVGSVTLVAGVVSYSPNGEFNGLALGEEATDTFQYTISDGNGGSDSAAVTVTITGENDEPVAADDPAAATDEDTAFDVDVLGNDGDDDLNDILEVSAIDTAGTTGTVTLTDGVVNYDPAGAFEDLGDEDSEIDTFGYTVSDGNGGTDTAVVTVTVSGVNDAPDAVDDDEESTDEDTSFEVDVLGNDDDPESDELTVTSVDDALTTGTVTLDEGAVTYDPAGAFEDLGDGDEAVDTFTYAISDGNGGTDTATVTVTVSGVNDNPDAVDDTAGFGEDGPAAAVDVLGNDDDPEGDVLTVTSVDDETTSGAVSLVDGVVTYDPDGAFESLAAGEEGTDEFGYSISDGNGGTDDATVTVTVTGVNDAPVAVDDDEVSTDEDTPVDIAVLDNDSDVDDSDELTVTVTVDPEDGTAVVNEDGTVTYTPDPDFNGEDSFTYQVDDGNGGTDTAIVTVTVDPVNDDPVADDDEATTDEDTPVDIAVLDNDDDVDDEVLTVSITVEPENGTAEVNEDGTVTYTPDEDFNGEDSFEYEAADDEAGTDTAQVSITVDPVNDDPVAENDSGSEYRLNTGFATFITGDVLANDDDVDGDALTVSFVDLLGTQGQVTYLGDGTFLYENTAGLGEGAEDSWSYEVSDGNGGTDTATVTIRVNSVPVGVDDMPATDEATAFDVSVLPNDTDGDSDTLTVVAIDTAGTVGNVTLSAGVVNYDPNGQFDALNDGDSATDSFTYTVADGFGGTDVVTVTVTINGISPP